MSAYQDNQLQAAMRLRSYGLKPNMPGYGYQLQQMSNVGDPNPSGFEVEPPELPNVPLGTPRVGPTGGGVTISPEPSPTPVPSITTPVAPAGSQHWYTGAVDALNDDFGRSPIGQLMRLFHGHGIPDQRINNPNQVPITDYNDPSGAPITDYAVANPNHVRMGGGSQHEANPYGFVAPGLRGLSGNAFTGGTGIISMNRMLPNGQMVSIGGRDLWGGQGPVNLQGQDRLR